MTNFFEERDCLDCDRRCFAFNVLTPDELVELNKNRVEVKFKAGEIISKQAHSADHLVSFVSGLAKIYIESPNNKNLILRLVKPSTIITCPGIHVDLRHHFTTAAITDSVACFINLDVLKKLLKENIDFVNSYLSDFSLRSISIFEKFVSLTQKQMHGRIADALLYLSEQIFESQEFDMLLSRQELADMTAMTKESACRILKQFRDEGIIETQGNFLKIKQIEQLKNISRTG